MYEEFSQHMRSIGCREFKSKQVERNYAFDDFPDIPAESTYLKVAYPYNSEFYLFSHFNILEPALPANLSGSTFSHVFGTNTSALEQVLLKRKLMGPQWIRISGVDLSSRSLSWCKLELSVDSPKRISALDISTASLKSVFTSPPPFSIASICVKTAMDPLKKVNEVIAVSMIFYPEGALSVSSYALVSIQGNPSSDLNASQYTLIRQWNNIPVPSGFHPQYTTQHKTSSLEMVANERHLLNKFIARLHKLDPDVLVGHNFVGFSLDVILHRFKANKIELQWSKLGRLRRRQ